MILCQKLTLLYLSQSILLRAKWVNVNAQIHPKNSNLDGAALNLQHKVTLIFSLSHHNKPLTQVYTLLMSHWISKVASNSSLLNKMMLIMTLLGV